MNSQHFDLIRVTIFRVFRRVSVLLYFWILFAPQLQAAEPAFIRESIRARGMGNAFTAAANDEMLLFYNPAALRSVYYNMYEVVGFNTTTNENTINLGKSSSSFSTIGSIAGKKIYNEANLGLLSHVNSRFGWSLFSNGLLDIQVRNPIIPYLETKAYVQTGLAGGMAWSFLDYQLDLGLGVKLVQRSGIDTKLHIFDEAIIEFTEDTKTTKLQKKFVSKAAFAPDAGVIYHFDSYHNMEPKVAFSLQNIGGLDFEGAGKVPMTMNIGVSTESEFNGFDMILAADYRDLADSQEMISKGNIMTERNIKIGVEFGWKKLFNGHHLISLRAGRNGPYNSVGWSMNLFGFKVDFAKYSEEIGGYAGELEDKRTSLQVSLIF
ncbi:MAG: hypothetical protein DSY97_04860 [SAR324 cluster bacterium]|uniref:DUF5723 domain-containing protein n=1 Tax=SAR324 cluster bacterium TaxID=2024889 RepID=A0A432G7A3_9DELT|nr:MAG: hypothetical protein DSY97_04860 [SAR324 cluster bacterium]